MPEFLTVPELADLLRIKERKVYDLAAAGHVPCTRATGKLLFPEQDIRAWIASNQSGRRAARPEVFLGSHDPLLEWALRQSQCGLATYLDGSSDGLSRFAAGEGIATGLHICNGQDSGWNTDAVCSSFQSDNVVLISWAKRQRGLVFKKDLDAHPTSLSEIRGLRLAERQSQSGTHSLLQKLVEETPEGCELKRVGPYFSEQDAVLAVADGLADVAFGLEVMAHQFGLSFSPLVVEEFDLLVDRAAAFDRPFQTFLAFCQTKVFQDHAATLRGYSIECLGRVRWNA